MANAVCQLSHLMSAPPEHFDIILRHVFRYLNGTDGAKLTYKRDGDNVLFGCVDASWGDHKDSRRSTTGYVFFLNGSPISWTSKLQRQVALSSVEAEFVALQHAIQEATFLRKVLKELGCSQSGPTVIFEDNNGAASLADHPTSHSRTKHIDIRRKWLNEQLHGSQPAVCVKRVDSLDNMADIFTKPIDGKRHRELCARMFGSDIFDSPADGKRRRGIAGICARTFGCGCLF